jgi:hypothetical protein
MPRKAAMTSRAELKKARREDGLYAVVTCGNTAFKPWSHCKAHIPRKDWIARLAADRDDPGSTDPATR